MDNVNFHEKDDLRELWIYMSELVQVARNRGEEDKANEALRYYAESEKDEGLRTAFHLWIGDNLTMQMRYDEAIPAYLEIVRQYPDLTFNGKPDGYHWAAYALEQIATCYEKMMDPEKALDAYNQIFEGYPSGIPAAHLFYRKAHLLESVLRDGEAIDAYQKSAESSDPFDTDRSTAEFSRRQAAYLKNPGRVEAQPEDVSTAVVRALQAYDSDTLEQLASTTHFRIGVAGSELQFVSREKALELVIGDLKNSKILADPYQFDGRGSKLYVLTDGWNGSLLQGRVWLLITRLRDGWQWSGFVLSRPGQGWENLFPPYPRENNQRLEIPIKAPYQRGDSWRAGGLARFVTSFAPFVGGVIFLEDNFSGCGYGPGGFYYNDGTTHHDSHAFAIDFTRYVSGLPYFPDEEFKSVLSVQAGVVTFVISSFNDHDHSGDANRVEVDHPGLGDLLSVLFRRTPLIPPFKYRSGYWHLAGSHAIPVSVGMFVRQGARLGFTNDTGNSAFSHLHFVLQDRDLGYMSVRPSPLDGHRLEDGDGGSCVGSTNVAFP
jgi:tetratricopeptide (TPR) repeat protein